MRNVIRDIKFLRKMFILGLKLFKTEVKDVANVRSSLRVIF